MHQVGMHQGKPYSCQPHIFPLIPSECLLTTLAGIEKLGKSYQTWQVISEEAEELKVPQAELICSVTIPSLNVLSLS